MAQRKREKWTEETARAELAAWRASGLTMAEHCRRRGIRAKKLYWWKRRFDEGDARDAGAPAHWIEAAITGGRSGAALTVVLADGARVEVDRPEDVDIVWLSQLVAELRAEA